MPLYHPARTHRQQLRELLALNEVINTVMILKDKLRQLWSYRSRTWIQRRGQIFILDKTA